MLKNEIGSLSYSIIPVNQPKIRHLAQENKTNYASSCSLIDAVKMISNLGKNLPVGTSLTDKFADVIKNIDAKGTRIVT
jgi:hypothetical protein